MSITAFKPKHGDMSNLQHGLQRWAKYAGRRDPQLKILLRSGSPTERLLAVLNSKRKPHMPYVPRLPPAQLPSSEASASSVVEVSKHPAGASIELSALNLQGSPVPFVFARIGSGPLCEDRYDESCDNYNDENNWRGVFSDDELLDRTPLCVEDIDEYHSRQRHQRQVRLELLRNLCCNELQWNLGTQPILSSMDKATEVEDENSPSDSTPQIMRHWRHKYSIARLIEFHQMHSNEPGLEQNPRIECVGQNGPLSRNSSNSARHVDFEVNVARTVDHAVQQRLEFEDYFDNLDWTDDCDSDDLENLDDDEKSLDGSDSVFGDDNRTREVSNRLHGRIYSLRTTVPRGPRYTDDRSLFDFLSTPSDKRVSPEESREAHSDFPTPPFNGLKFRRKTSIQTAHDSLSCEYDKRAIRTSLSKIGFHRHSLKPGLMSQSSMRSPSPDGRNVSKEKTRGTTERSRTPRRNRRNRTFKHHASNLVSHIIYTPPNLSPMEQDSRVASPPRSLVNPKSAHRTIESPNVIFICADSPNSPVSFMPESSIKDPFAPNEAPSSDATNHRRLESRENPWSSLFSDTIFTPTRDKNINLSISNHRLAYEQWDSCSSKQHSPHSGSLVTLLTPRPLSHLCSWELTSPPAKVEMEAIKAESNEGVPSNNAHSVKMSPVVAATVYERTRESVRIYEQRHSWVQEIHPPRIKPYSSSSAFATGAVSPPSEDANKAEIVHFRDILVESPTLPRPKRQQISASRDLLNSTQRTVQFVEISNTPKHETIMESRRGIQGDTSRHALAFNLGNETAYMENAHSTLLESVSSRRESRFTVSPTPPPSRTEEALAAHRTEYTMFRRQKLVTLRCPTNIADEIDFKTVTQSEDPLDLSNRRTVKLMTVRNGSRRLLDAAAYWANFMTDLNLLRQRSARPFSLRVAKELSELYGSGYLKKETSGASNWEPRPTATPKARAISESKQASSFTSRRPTGRRSLTPRKIRRPRSPRLRRSVQSRSPRNGAQVLGPSLETEFAVQPFPAINSEIHSPKDIGLPEQSPPISASNMSPPKTSSSAVSDPAGSPSPVPSPAVSTSFASSIHRQSVLSSGRRKLSQGSLRFSRNVEPLSDRLLEAYRPKGIRRFRLSRRRSIVPTEASPEVSSPELPSQLENSAGPTTAAQFLKETVLTAEHIQRLALLASGETELFSPRLGDGDMARVARRYRVVLRESTRRISSIRKSSETRQRNSEPETPSLPAGQMRPESSSTLDTRFISPRPLTEIEETEIVPTPPETRRLRFASGSAFHPRSSESWLRADSEISPQRPPKAPRGDVSPKGRPRANSTLARVSFALETPELRHVGSWMSAIKQQLREKLCFGRMRKSASVACSVTTSSSLMEGWSQDWLSNDLSCTFSSSDLSSVFSSSDDSSSPSITYSASTSHDADTQISSPIDSKTTEQNLPSFPIVDALVTTEVHQSSCDVKEEGTTQTGVYPLRVPFLPRAPSLLSPTSTLPPTTPRRLELSRSRFQDVRTASIETDAASAGDGRLDSRRSSVETKCGVEPHRRRSSGCRVELRRMKIRRIEVFAFEFMRKHHIIFTQLLIAVLLLVPCLLFSFEVLTRRLDYIVPPMNLVIDASGLYARWNLP
eukprot:Gregarina_sp_Poly_1__4922@NODE_260_length_10473_cov_240_642802_g227_i0_p1_GENE_NODE_260_length_10473_cov_240_642802_g227_i0NODE_260_length_10473_cov_240_642802_g227_i0_p1_ORF_typecomplete_len1619_score215_76_NODE_260_length_10473_cov_240_642802_g227_i04075263